MGMQTKHTKKEEEAKLHN